MIRVFFGTLAITVAGASLAGTLYWVMQPIAQAVRAAGAG